MKLTPHDPRDATDHNRMIIAVILSLVILLGYEMLFARDTPPPQPATQAEAVARTATLSQEAAKPLTREQALSGAGRIAIKGARVTGSLSLKGARLDDLSLNGHYKTVEKKEPVSLLNPSRAPHAFYAESGWVAERAGIAVPGPDTVWSLVRGSATVLESNGKPVVLQWDNGQGLVFERALTLDGNYLFSVTQRIINNTGESLSFNPYYLVSRTGRPPDFQGTYILHEGPIGYLGEKHVEASYNDLADGEKTEENGTHGWLGITDRYWMVTLLPQPGDTFNARIVGDAAQHFQTDIVESTLTVAPGQTAENKVWVYAGVKDLGVMQSYQQQYGFRNLNLNIDFGIWFFITQPFYMLFHFLAGILGHIGFAILAITVLIRVALFPLATRSYISMARMKVIMPMLKEIQAKHKDDKVAMQMEIMDLYKRENANPFSGCWPLIVQIPIFFALYKVILLSAELRHAPFPGWVYDLSAPDPTNIFTLFGLIPWEPPGILHIGLWPLLFCLTMIVQKRLSPPMPDPVQEKIHTYFPYFITVMLANFAAGLVIYWTWSNTLAVLQQYYILRKYGQEEVSLLRGHHQRRKPKKAGKDKGKS